MSVRWSAGPLVRQFLLKMRKTRIYDTAVVIVGVWMCECVAGVVGGGVEVMYEVGCPYPPVCNRIRCSFSNLYFFIISKLFDPPLLVIVNKNNTKTWANVTRLSLSRFTSHSGQFYTTGRSKLNSKRSRADQTVTEQDPFKSPHSHCAGEHRWYMILVCVLLTHVWDIIFWKDQEDNEEKFIFQPLILGLTLQISISLSRSHPRFRSVCSWVSI